MTNEEKFRKGTVLYKNDWDTYVLELWGGSTKHPDSVFYFEDFNTVNYLSDDAQVFQWLLECASKLTMPFHAYELAKFAMEVYNNGIEAALCMGNL